MTLTTTPPRELTTSHFNTEKSRKTDGKCFILFNDALNTFYLRRYGVKHMVKDHSDSERGNPLPPHGLLVVTQVMEHWLEREIAQWVHSMNDRSDDPSHHERTLLPRSYISLPRKIVSTTSMLILRSFNSTSECF